jgi:hypothetical protein
MAKAIFEAPTSPSEQPNQQQTDQIYQNFPKPRVEFAITQESPQATDSSDELFSTIADPEDITHATLYIAEQLQDRQSIKAGAFIIGLLEKFHSIPAEVVAEEKGKRKARIALVEQLMLDLQQFVDESGKFDGATFMQEISDKIGEDKISGYPIVQLLRSTINQMRRTASKNSYAEVQLVTAQRIALLGIAKQRGVYN